MEDGSKAHLIQKELQAGLKGSGKQLLRLESGQGILKNQLAKLSPKHANGPGVSRITDLVFNSAISPGPAEPGENDRQELHCNESSVPRDSLGLCAELRALGTAGGKGLVYFWLWRKECPSSCSEGESLLAFDPKCYRKCVSLTAPSRRQQ